MSPTPTKILLDTNVFFATHIHKRLEQQVRAQRLEVYIPALVIMERERQIVQKASMRSVKNKSSNSDKLVDFRQWVGQIAFDLETQIIPFDYGQAQSVSKSWQEWVEQPQPAEPHYLTRSLGVLEMGYELARRYRVKNKSKSYLLPDLDWVIHKLDWAIAAAARDSDYLIITNDSDPPFKQKGVKTMTVSEFEQEYLST